MPQSDMTGSIQESPKLPTVKDFPATGPYSLAAPAPRFGARAIDFAIVATPALAVVASSYHDVAGQLQLDTPDWLLAAFVAFGMIWEFAFVALFGRTPGKMLLGLRIVRYTDGQRPDPLQSALRSIVPWTMFALPIGPFAVGAFLAIYGTGLAGELHRGVPDQAGGTLVISTR